MKYFIISAICFMIGIVVGESLMMKQVNNNPEYCLNVCVEAFTKFAC